MNTQQLQRVKEIYEAVADCDPARRAALLEQWCAHDELVRAEVEALLGFLPQAADFIEQAPFFDQSLLNTVAQSLPPGRRLGPYEVLSELGRGGMGVVYLAVRADDAYRQQVAIKLVWPGYDGAEVVRRFQQERQILAQLDHPHITRLLDGGTTEEGWPYVVMEYVDGQPLNQYCDAHKLSVKQRLELFQQVCAAVAYAHRHLVVHRDLKPSNILVTEAGAVKLLDFGIAKLLDPALRPEALSLTITGLHAMTPEYASPEQVRGGEITTASDVYSLGVVLYELLTGQQPYHFSSRALHEVMRVIAEEEPLRPSRVGSPSFSRKDPFVTLPAEAGATNTFILSAVENTPDKLRRRLTGDLDKIILKALCKEPEQRYASVWQLSEDLARHCAGQPVLARKPTFGYSARKFVRRHQTSVALTAFIVLLLIAGLSYVARQTLLARAQAREQRRALYAAQMAQAIREWESGNLKRVREQVEAYLPQPETEDLRGFEWYHFWRLLHREQVTLAHDDWVTDARFFNDEKSLFTAVRNETQRIWDWQTGRVLRTIQPGNGSTLRWQNTGYYTQRSDDHTLKVLESSTGKELRSLSDSATAIQSFSSGYPAESTLITGGADGSIKIWDWERRAVDYVIKSAGPPVTWLHAWPGRLLARIGDSNYELWDTNLRRLSKVYARPAAVWFAPNYFILDDTRGNLKLYNRLTGQPLLTIRDRPDNLTGLVCNDQRIYTIGRDAVVKVWELRTGRKLGELAGHTGWINVVCQSDDGRLLATGGGDRTVRLWEAEKLRELAVIRGHLDEIVSVHFSANNRLLATGSRDRTAKVWELDSLLAPDTLAGHTDRVFAVAFAPDSRRLATGSGDHTIKLWDTATGQLLQTFVGHEREVFAVAFAPTGRQVASASADHTVRVWDSATGAELFKLQAFNTLVRSVAFSPDGRQLAASSHAVTPSNQPEPATIRVWDATTGRALLALSGHTKEVMSVAFAPDGQRLATGSMDETVRVWDAATGRLLLTLKGHSDEVFAVAFSPDGQRIGSASNDKTVKLWDAATGRELVSFNQHRDEVWSVAFAPDGQTLASGSWDKTARLYHAATESEVKARLRQ